MSEKHDREGSLMYWQQRPDPNNRIDQIRYFADHNNELTENELRDAFGDKGEQFVTC